MSLLESRLGRRFEKGYDRKVKCIRLQHPWWGGHGVQEFALVFCKYSYQLHGVREVVVAADGWMVGLDMIDRLHRRFNNLHTLLPAFFQPLGPRSPVPHPPATPTHKTHLVLAPPHTYPTKHPIIFLHGIGIGLYPYTSFLHDLAALDPTVGVLVLEFMPLSFRFSHTPLSKSAFTEEFTAILTQHDIQNFMLVSHSYGTVLSTWLLHCEHLA